MPQHRFGRIERLPPYVLGTVNEWRRAARARGEDIIDLGMGNPDEAAPAHVVAKLQEVAGRRGTHGYSQSRGIPRLRRAICNWYGNRYGVVLDPDHEAIVTMGSKEGLAHLAMALTEPGDVVLVPDPSYPVHPYGFVIAGADIRRLPMPDDGDEDQFFDNLDEAVHTTLPRPKVLVLNFPSNPTTQCVTLDFFHRVIEAARRHDLWVIHDLAYADLCFDGYAAPSILQVPGARDWAVESFSLSKSYSMAGFRVGFLCGNAELVHALGRLKSYLDYGTFTPIQVAAIAALEGPQGCVIENRERYRLRRDVLIEGLGRAGWQVPPSRATMFVWARIPEPYLEMGSLAFAKLLVDQAHVAVSPGIGFGERGEGHVRFALVENTERIRQATRNIKKALRLL